MMPVVNTRIQPFRRNIRELARNEWTADSVVENCNCCKEKFYTFRRKHHCRCCGEIFCDQCSNYKIEIEGRFVRSCAECAEWAQKCVINETKTRLDISTRAEHYCRERSAASWQSTKTRFFEDDEVDSLFEFSDDEKRFVEEENASPPPEVTKVPLSSRRRRRRNHEIPEISGKEPNEAPWWKKPPPCKTCDELREALRNAIHSMRWAEAERLFNEDALNSLEEIPQPKKNSIIFQSVQRLARDQRIPERVRFAADTTLSIWKQRYDALTPPKFAVGDAVLFTFDKENTSISFYAHHPHYQQQKAIDATIVAVHKGPPHTYKVSLLEDDDHHEADENMLKPMPPDLLLSL